jgi:hypothetical protein
MWTPGHVVLRVVNVACVDLELLAFSRHLVSQCQIARKLVCSFWESMAGSGSVAMIAVSSAKVAMVESGEVGGSV